MLDFVFLVSVKVLQLEMHFLCLSWGHAFFFSLWCSICVALVQHAKQSWQMLTDFGNRPVFSPCSLECFSHFPMPALCPYPSVSLCLCAGCHGCIAAFPHHLLKQTMATQFISELLLKQYHNLISLIQQPLYFDLYCTAWVPVPGEVFTSSHLGMRKKETVS